MFGFKQRNNIDNVELFDDTPAAPEPVSTTSHQQMFDAAGFGLIAFNASTGAVEYANAAAGQCVSGVYGGQFSALFTQPEIQQAFKDQHRLPFTAAVELQGKPYQISLSAVAGPSGPYSTCFVCLAPAAQASRSQGAGQKNQLQTIASSARDLESTLTVYTQRTDELGAVFNESITDIQDATQSVEMVAAASGELSSSITEISRRVAESSQMSQDAVTEAQRTNTIVESLAEASDKIGEVVNLIQDIAEKTNLLALNATIEAARAGDAGKGFAVVADEVKTLAGQTAKATEDIARQINQIQGSTGMAVQAISSIGETIERLSEINTGIAAAVEEQGAATHEITRNVKQASSRTQEVASRLQGIMQQSSDSDLSRCQSNASTIAQQADALYSAL